MKSEFIFVKDKWNFEKIESHFFNGHEIEIQKLLSCHSQHVLFVTFSVNNVSMAGNMTLK